MNRRSFLSLLGLAPIGAPVLAKAATAADTAVRIVGGELTWASAVPLQRPPLERHDLMVKILPRGGSGDGDRALLVFRPVVCAAEAQLGDFPLHRLIPGNPAAGVATRLVVLPADAAFLAIDDVGGGP